MVMRSMHPPEADRGGFDPVAEGKRHGLSREQALAVWKQACAEASDPSGRLDPGRARQRFHELAVESARSEARRKREVGRGSRAEDEGADATRRALDGNAAGGAPGRTTLVAAEAKLGPPGAQELASVSGAHRADPSAEMAQLGGGKGKGKKKPPGSPVGALSADTAEIGRGGDGAAAGRPAPAAASRPQAQAQAGGGGQIRFAPTDLGRLMGPIGPQETIEDRRANERAALEAHEAARAHATARLSGFAQAANAQADGIRGLQPGLDAQLRAGETRACAQVDAAAAQQAAAVRAHVAQAIAQAEAAGQAARAQVEAAYTQSVAAIERSATRAKQQIDQSHRTQLQSVTTQQQNQLTLLGTLYTEAAEKFRAAGRTAGEHATSVAGRMANEYLSQMIHRDDSFLDGPLTDNRCKARAEAAQKVGEAYKSGLAEEAEKQVGKLNERRPTDEGTVRTIAEQARTNLETAHKNSLDALDTAKKQSLEAAQQTKTQLLTQIDGATTSTISGLDRHGQAQTRAIQQQATQSKQSIRQQRQQASTQIGAGIEQASAALRRGAQQMVGALSGAEVPVPEVLDQALEQADGQLDQQLVQLRQSLTQGAAQSAQSLGQAATQSAQSIQQTAQAAIEGANSTLAAARTSFTQMATGGQQSLQQLATGFETQAGETAKAAQTGFESVANGLRDTYTQLTTNFRDGAQANADAVRDGLMGAVDTDMPPKIESEAEAAAAQVQPRWKSVLKWVIIIAIVLVVAIVIGPMVIGAVAGAAAALGASAGVASVVGAVVGGALVGAGASAATTMVDNAFSGRAIFEGVAEAAMWGAIGGAVGGAVSSALGPAMKGMSIAGKIALQTTTDVVVDTGLSALQGNLSWESFGQGLFMSLLTNGVTAHPRVEAFSGRFETAGTNFGKGAGERIRPPRIDPGAGGAGGAGSPSVSPTPDAGGGGSTAPRADSGAGGGGNQANTRPGQGQGGATPRPDQGGGATPRPDQGQGGAQTRPDQGQGGAQTRPDQGQGGAQTRPDQGQGGAQTRPDQGQGGAQTRPDQGQGGAQTRPDQGQGGAQTRPDQGQGGAQTRPDQGQGGAQTRPDQGEGGAQTRPDQGEGGAQTRPDQSQDGAQTRPDQSQDGDGAQTRPDQSQDGAQTRPDQSQDGDGAQTRPDQGQDGDGAQTRPDQGQDGAQTRPDQNGAQGKGDQDGPGGRPQGKGDQDGPGGRPPGKGDQDGATGRPQGKGDQDTTPDQPGQQTANDGTTRTDTDGTTVDPKQPTGPGGYQSDAISLTGKGDALGDAVKWLKPVPGKLDVVVHGDADGFYVLKDGGYVKLDHRAMAKYIKKNGGAGMDIRLISCGTGESPTAIAQHLSNKLGVDVTAPTDTVWIHPDGKLTIGKNPTHNTGDWNTFRPGTRPDANTTPKADGTTVRPEGDTTTVRPEGDGSTVRPEGDGTTPTETDAGPTPRAAGVDEPAGLTPEMKAIRDGLSGDAQKGFDSLWTRNNGDPARVQKALDGMTRGGKSIPETLAAQYQKAQASQQTKPPFGEAADQIPALQQKANRLQQMIDGARGRLPDAVANRLTKAINSEMGSVNKAADGKVETTQGLIDGPNMNLSSIEAELNVALRENGVTDMGMKVDTVANGKTEPLDIDVVSEGGKRWIEVKNKGTFGLDSSAWSNNGSGSNRGVKEQAELMLKAARENAVDGVVPEVVIDFPKGVSPEVADALTAMGVTVRGERVPVPEVNAGKGTGGKTDGDDTTTTTPKTDGSTPEGPISAGIPPRTDTTTTPRTDTDTTTTPRVDEPVSAGRPQDGISGGKVTHEDFLGTPATDAETANAKLQAQAERTMSLDEQAESILTGTARSERDMLLAIQNGEMPRFIARVGPKDNFGRGTFANPNRPFSFAAEPADLRGISPAEAMYKVGWTESWIKPNIGKEIVIAVLDTDVAVPNAAGGGDKIAMGRMEWPELTAKALSDPNFALKAQDAGIDPAELPGLFDIASRTPVRGAPDVSDPAVAGKVSSLRDIINDLYGANDLYTGMGATMNEGGGLGGREIMMQPNGTGLKLTPDNHRLVSLGIMTQAHYDALFPPPGTTTGTGAASSASSTPPAPPDPSVTDPGS